MTDPLSRWVIPLLIGILITVGFIRCDTAAILQHVKQMERAR